MMITIFKTDIATPEDVEKVDRIFKQHLLNIKWTVDLSDCDRIMRVESVENTGDRIIFILKKLGYDCIRLEIFNAPPQWA